MHKLRIFLLAACLLFALPACQSRTMPAEQPVVESSYIEEAEEPMEPAEEIIPPEADSQPQEQDEAAPTQLVLDMLAAIKTGDENEIQPYIDYDALLGLDETTRGADWQFQQILRHVSWREPSCNLQGDAADVYVTISNVDMELVLPDFFQQSMDLQYKNSLSENPLGDVDMAVQYVKIFEDLLAANENETVETEVKITLKRIGDEWKIFPNEKLCEAVLGNYFTVRSSLG